jgi:hypothetical protein
VHNEIEFDCGKSKKVSLQFNIDVISNQPPQLNMHNFPLLSPIEVPPFMSFCSPPHVIQNCSIRNPSSSSRSFSNGLRWKIKVMSLMLLYKNKQVNHIGTYGHSKQNGRSGIYGWCNYDLKVVGKMTCYRHSCTCPIIWAMVGCKSMQYSFVKDLNLSNEHKTCIF